MDTPNSEHSFPFFSYVVRLSDLMTQSGFCFLPLKQIP
jgi:hypothetical protein